MVVPTPLGRGPAFATGAAGGSVQRRLRKMSTHPEDPRVFFPGQDLGPAWVDTQPPYDAARADIRRRVS